MSAIQQVRVRFNEADVDVAQHIGASLVLRDTYRGYNPATRTITLDIKSLPYLAELLEGYGVRFQITSMPAP